MAVFCVATLFSVGPAQAAQTQGADDERIKRSNDCSLKDAETFIEQTATLLLQEIRKQRKEQKAQEQKTQEQKTQTGEQSSEQARAQQQLYRASYKAILRQAFAYNALARSLIGPYWRKMSPQQRATYQELIGEILEITISNNIYTLPVLDYDLTQVSPLGQDFAVRLLVRLENESEAVPIVWRVRCFQGKGQIKGDENAKNMGIIDLLFRNVSVVAGKRAEMTSIVSKQGVAQFLILLMQERAKLRAQ